MINNYSKITKLLSADELINLNKTFYKQGYKSFDEQREKANQYAAKVNFSNLENNIERLIKQFNVDLITQNLLLEKMIVYMFIRELQYHGVEVKNRDGSAFTGFIDKYNAITIDDVIYNIKVQTKPSNYTTKFRELALLLNTRQKLNPRIVEGEIYKQAITFYELQKEAAKKVDRDKQDDNDLLDA